MTILRNAKPIIDTLCMWGMPKFHGETFAGGSKTVKLVNVFSLKSFLLYGTKHCNFSSRHIIKSNLILYMVLLNQPC